MSPAQTAAAGSGRSGVPADLDVDALLGAAVSALGGAPRAGQQEMARAVAASFGSGEHLLVQAGTGTGKSLGYLVPALAHAVAHEEVVVVSTATLALQAQVVGRDLPAVAAALAPSLGREPTFALVKGRSNYVCRHKLVGGFPDEPESSLFDLPGADPASAASDHPRPSGAARSPRGASSWLGREVARVHAWADETTTGDRDDLLPGVSDRAWSQVSVSARECLGAARCPLAQECFVELARAAAREVDVVVTNHAFLALDAFEDRPLLPEHSAVVVDEAHELADRVTSAVAVQLSASGAAAAATSAKRSAGVDASRLEVAAADLADVLEPLAGGRFAQGLPEALGLAVAGVRDAARAALSQLGGGGGQGGGGEVDDAASRQVARAALAEVFDAAERLAAVAPGGGDVAWLAVSPPGEAARSRGPARVLHVAPLSVAGPLRERLFGTRTAVLTSATLTLGGSFEATAGRVGLRGSGAPRWRAADVGSPFDYPRQGILYTAAHLPAPGRGGASPQALEELAALVEAAGGRALGLFSSRRAAEEAAAAMRERLDVPVLCQGEDSVASLVRRFAADEATCLFGTLSLWQGVDVPGRACSLVVLDRIPFPRPDDPLASARSEAADRAGANGFLAVSASHAALLLAQGAGRLIRSTSDRGVVAVLDPRLATARYAGYLRASLPPMWPTTDREVVLSALRRLAGAPVPAPRGA